jgi:hypothetical protein
MKPIRVQRKRVKGWKMPPNTVSVTRPGKWGNPFIGEGAVDKFRECLLNSTMTYIYFYEVKATEEYYRFKWMAENLYLLRGRNLACFCPLDKPCHADVLLELSNLPNTVNN